MLKGKFNFVLTMSLVMVLVLGIGLVVQAEEYVLRLAHISDENHPSHKGAVLFKQLVEERTEGAVTIEIYPNSTLGSAPEYTEQIQIGAVDLGLSTSGQMQEWVKEYAAIMIPFLFESYEHAHRTLDGKAGDLLAEKAEKEGMVVLSNWEWGFRQITNNKTSINSPDDIKGLKMRVPNEIQLQAMYKALGANTNIVAFPELYMALSQGVVEGQCNPLATIYHHNLYEVQDYLALTNHIYNTQMLIASEVTMNTLPDKYQRVLKESAQVAGMYVRQLNIASEDELVTLLKEEGMEVTRPDLDAFRVKMDPAIKTISEFAGEEFTAEFIEYVEEAR